jgi:NADPH2 dehydrogenase
MIFEPIKIKDFTFKNRIVLAPMCMYMADENGNASNFHIMHYGTRAIGGVSLVIQEATAVSKEGRISVNDLGIWDDSHIFGLKKIVEAIHENGSIAGIQINHAGRKSKTVEPIAPSSIPFNPDDIIPKEMTKEDIHILIDDFKQAARRAHLAGYDVLEIHGAHGYLVFQFLSPITNHRNDQYKAGVTLLKEIIEAIQTEWPKEKILALRISATEYVNEGITPDIIGEMINQIKHLGLDMIDVSSGGNVIVPIKPYFGYQLKLAKRIKEITGLPVVGGGLVEDLMMAEFALSDHLCDFVYMGRALLRDPYLVLNQAKLVGFDIKFPEPYKRSKK